jgi:hypothetical protein
MRHSSTAETQLQVPPFAFLPEFKVEELQASNVPKNLGFQGYLFGSLGAAMDGDAKLGCSNVCSLSDLIDVGWAVLRKVARLRNRILGRRKRSEIQKNQAGREESSKAPLKQGVLMVGPDLKNGEGNGWRRVSQRCNRSGSLCCPAYVPPVKMVGRWQRLGWGVRVASSLMNCGARLEGSQLPPKDNSETCSQGGW